MSEMRAEQQYIDLFTRYEDLVCRHSAAVMNAPRAEALVDFDRLGFPSVTVSYTHLTLPTNSRV